MSAYSFVVQNEEQTKYVLYTLKVNVSKSQESLVDLG